MTKIFLFLLLSATPCFSGSMLTYRDESGTMHWVSSEGEIPEKYRKSQKKLGPISSGSPGPKAVEVYQPGTKKYQNRPENKADCEIAYQKKSRALQEAFINSEIKKSASSKQGSKKQLASYNEKLAALKSEAEEVCGRLR